MFLWFMHFTIIGGGRIKNYKNPSDLSKLAIAESPNMSVVISINKLNRPYGCSDTKR